MANTIKAFVKLDWLLGAVQRPRIPGTTYEVETTSELSPTNVQLVGTTHEVVAAGDVTDDALVVIENTHATAVVSVGGDDTGVFVPWLSIAPGDPPAILPRAESLAGTYLKSDTAATPVVVHLFKVVAPP